MREGGIRGDGGPHPSRRLTVAQAADQLGISVDAVRARIKRETIEHVREGGRVYVLLGADQDDASHAQDNAQDADQASPEDAHDYRDELLEELKDRVRYLEEESRRKDHLLAAALERIPAIEAPSEATGGSETVSEEPRRGDVPSGDQGPHHPVERPSWWRKFFGFE
jgi:hypothetical protein